MNPGFREGAWLPGLSPRSWPDTDQQVVCILVVCIWPESPQEVVESPPPVDSRPPVSRESTGGV